MAVVYRFPDRIAADPERSKALDGFAARDLRTAEVIILPCIRRERIDSRQIDGHVAPTQLQA